jgi:hypothetical protein
LRQLGTAFHKFEEKDGHMPAAVILGKEGKPLLSWRVAILPFIEQDELYKQFYLDEPWDSEHNKKLLPTITKAYAPLRGRSPKEPHSTYTRSSPGQTLPSASRSGWARK